MKSRFYSLFFIMMLIFTFASLLSSCKKHSPYEGEWKGQINSRERVELKIKDNNEFWLKFYQSNQRYDITVKGEVIKVSDEIVKLAATTVFRDYDPHRRYASDPVTQISQTTDVFFLRMDGSLSKTESGLDNPMAYLTKSNSK